MGCFGETKRKSFRHSTGDCLSQEQHAELLRGNNMCTAKKMIINKDEDDELEIWGYKTHKFKTFLTYLCIILTAGILRLIFHWVPHWYVFVTSSLCYVTDADKLLIVETFKEKHKIYYVKQLKTLTSKNINERLADPELAQPVLDSLKVHFENGEFKEVDQLITFTCKKVTYIWYPEKQEFMKLIGLDEGVDSETIHQNTGLTAEEQYMRRIVYGSNRIDVQESTILTLLFLEVLNPFYIFQIASLTLWFLNDYYYYAVAIILMSVFGISMTVIQTRKNQRNLKSTVHSSDVCKVLRKKPNSFENELEPYTIETISTELLVPGDIMVIPAHGCIMHCDALLLTGNCILNESMLTGESVPVTKTSFPNIPDVIYDPKEHSKHTLFCGTHVIQTRYFGNENVLAVVVRTGFSTAKGSLVRSILYPPPVDFRFEKDSYKFVIMLSGLAILGFCYTVTTKILRGVKVSEIIFEAFDLITIVIPPALPAAMTVGSFYAQIRLKKNQIFCISPRSINVSGSVDCVCFDKTGTLTEDGLDLLCVVPVTNKYFSSPVEKVDILPYNTLVCGLVSCHSLTIIDKKIVGDPLDLKMFESTKWIMEDNDIDDNNKFDMIFPTVLKPPKGQFTTDQNMDDLEIGIIREFPFSSSLQRMGVIIRKITANNFEYYCKGSPEMILNFVSKETIPLNFSEILENYTQEGCRVIAIAHKELKLSYAKVHKVQREAIEQDMTFLGLIVLENRLKPDTTPVIQVLNEASIRVIMVTGDNILTALSVAKDCDLVQPNQNIITVNADNSEPPQLFYTLNNFKNKIPNDSSILSNSASIASLDTVESQVITYNSTNNGPVTVGGNEGTRKTGNGTYDVPKVSNYRFAMTGKVWEIARDYHPDVLPKLVTRGTIFARMSPEQKQQLVQELQALGYYVAMCGDGANDCGALKAAHTGVSLSEAESSVASPFTSKNPDIRCVLNVIREGRAALVTSFGIFKYMAAYSLCQFISILILYSIDSNLTDMEFLYIDLFIISIFAFFFGKTEPYKGKLVKETPLSSLISFSSILSLVLQIVLIIIFQVAAFEYLRFQSWYIPFNKDLTGKDAVGCYENFTIFTVSSFQYISLAIAFSKGKPYRKSIFSNYGFLLSAICLLSFSVYLALIPAPFLVDLLQLKLPEEFNFRLDLLMFAGVNFILSILVEQFIIDNLVFKKWRFKFHNIDKSKRKFLAVERDLGKDHKWPPISSDFKSEASVDSTMITTAAEIVVEKENKFDKNHVLNKLYRAESLARIAQVGSTDTLAIFNETVRRNSELSPPKHNPNFGHLAQKPNGRLRTISCNAHFSPRETRQNASNANYNSGDGRFNVGEGRYNSSDARIQNSTEARHNSSDHYSSGDIQSNSSDRHFNSSDHHRNSRDENRNSSDRHYNSSDGRHNSSDGRHNSDFHQQNGDVDVCDGVVNCLSNGNHYNGDFTIVLPEFVPNLPVTEEQVVQNGGDDLFSSLPSENNTSPSFKSCSQSQSYDFANSQNDVTDLPYDESDSSVFNTPLKAPANTNHVKTPSRDSLKFRPKDKTKIEMANFKNS